MAKTKKTTVSSAMLSAVMREMGKRGGPARAKALSARRRLAIARKGAAAAKRARRERKRRPNGDGFAAMHADDFVHVSSKRPPRAAAKMRRQRRKRST
jgi:hypothetical protein